MIKMNRRTTYRNASFDGSGITRSLIKNQCTRLFILIFGLLGFVPVVSAQSTDNETITANARVLGTLKVGEQTNDLNFGNILINSAKRVQAVDGSVTALAAETNLSDTFEGGEVNGITGGEERGWFDITADPGTELNVEVRIPGSINLSQAEGLFIVFTEDGSTPINGSDNTLNGLITETQPSGTNTLTPIDGGAGDDFQRIFGSMAWRLGSSSFLQPFEMPASGKVYFVIGGEVVAEADTSPGMYTGNIELEVSVPD